MNKITVEEVKRLDAERAQGDWKLHKFISRGDDYYNVSFDNEWGMIAGNLYDEFGIINENNADFIAAAPRIAALCIEQADEIEMLKSLLRIHDNDRIESDDDYEESSLGIRTLKALGK